jgi:hypothetical protein
VHGRDLQVVASGGPQQGWDEIGQLRFAATLLQLRRAQSLHSGAAIKVEIRLRQPMPRLGQSVKLCGVWRTSRQRVLARPQEWPHDAREKIYGL